MKNRLPTLLLALGVSTAIGCQANLDGVTSVNDPIDFAKASSITVFSADEPQDRKQQASGSTVITHKMQLPNIKDDAVGAGLVQKQQDDVIDFQLPEFKDPEVRPSPTSEYVGLTIEQAQTLAQQHGHAFRSVDESGTITADYCPSRVTAHVKDGIVWAADFGY